MKGHRGRRQFGSGATVMEEGEGHAKTRLTKVALGAKEKLDRS